MLVAVVPTAVRKIKNAIGAGGASKRRAVRAVQEHIECVAIFWLAAFAQNARTHCWVTMQAGREAGCWAEPFVAS